MTVHGIACQGAGISVEVPSPGSVDKSMNAYLMRHINRIVSESATQGTGSFARQI